MTRLERILIDRGHDNDDIYWLCIRQQERMDEIIDWFSSTLDGYIDDDEEQRNDRADAYGTIEFLIVKLCEFQEQMISDVEGLDYVKR